MRGEARRCEARRGHGRHRELRAATSAIHEVVCQGDASEAAVQHLRAACAGLAHILEAKLAHGVGDEGERDGERMGAPTGDPLAISHRLVEVTKSLGRGVEPERYDMRLRR